jgi:hypothetical protein
MLVRGPVAVTVVAIVLVCVDEASSVVSENAVPGVVTTTVPTVEVAISEPSELTVVPMTVMAVRVAVISTGTLMTV